MMTKKKICVIGLGYIGLPTSALLANRGYDVHGVDVVQSTVDTINRGEIHIVEPELDTFVKAAVNSGKLKASLTPENADIFIIAVPTPFHAGFVPNIWSEQFFTGNVSGIMGAVIGISSTRAQLDKFFGDDLMYDFNAFNKKLRLFEPFEGNLLIHYTKEYIPEAVDYIYDATWVKRYAVVLSRLKQSIIAGK
jgi:hypothetical protein